MSCSCRCRNLCMNTGFKLQIYQNCKVSSLYLYHSKIQKHEQAHGKAIASRAKCSLYETPGHISQRIFIVAAQLGYSAGEFQALQLIVLAAFAVVD